MAWLFYKAKEQGLPFLPSQICWMFLVGMALGNGEQGSSLDVSGLEEERLVMGEGWETHMGTGIIFDYFPQEIMAVLVYRGWKQDCMPLRAL